MALSITTANYQEIIDSGKPVVIDFWAEWCGPCRMVGPIIDELAAEYDGKVVIGKCDVDENDALAVKFGSAQYPYGCFPQGRRSGRQADRRGSEKRFRRENR